jgi:hypothetical protein
MSATCGEEHDDGACPNCGGEGWVYGCFEDTCCGEDCDELGCSPSRCDWCRPNKPKEPDHG